MSHIRIDSSVPRHRKFVQAGPAPSWLWVCGLAYCQEGLTDGFIPVEAIEYLGVKNARRLAVHLEKARLWEKVSGGWQVHDYLEHNKSAAQVNAIKHERREFGRAGGKASGESRTKQVASTDTNQFASTMSKQHGEAYVEPICTGDVVVAASVVVPKEGGVGETPAFDAMFWQLHRAYPEKRRSSGPITEQIFVQQFQSDTRKAAIVFAEMLANLQTQIAGHEWRVKGMVPKLEKWLRDGLWRQRHEVTPVSEMLSEKTARTLASAAAFVKAGERGA